MHSFLWFGSDSNKSNCGRCNTRSRFSLLSPACCGSHGNAILSFSLPHTLNAIHRRGQNENKIANAPPKITKHYINSRSHILVLYLGLINCLACTPNGREQSLKWFWKSLKFISCFGCASFIALSRCFLCSFFLLLHYFDHAFLLFLSVFSMNRARWTNDGGQTHEDEGDSLRTKRKQNDWNECERTIQWGWKRITKTTAAIAFWMGQGNASAVQNKQTEKKRRKIPINGENTKSFCH